MVHEIDRRTLLAGLGLAGVTGLAAPGLASADPAGTRADDPLDLEFRIREKYRPFDLIAPRFVQYDSTVGRVRSTLVDTGVRPRAPYGSVLVEVRSLDGAVVAGLVGDRTVLGAYYGANATIEVDGEVVASTPASLVAPFGFAVVVNENAVTVLADPTGTGTGWQPLVTSRDPVHQRIDLRVPDVLGQLNYGYGGRGDALLGRVRAGYFGQAGVRDPHVVQHADGRPYIRDGKLYLTLTNAGLGFFQQAHWAVWTLDLADPTRLEQVATLFFARDGVVLGDHAGQIVYDRGRFVVAMSSWGDFDFRGVHIRHATTTANVLSGVHVLATEPLPLPTSVSSWDPALTRIGGRWHVAFVESPAQQPAFVFHPALAVGPRGADYAEGLSLAGADTSVDQTEGTILQRFGSTWHVLASDGDARQYKVYDLRMRLLGTLNAPYGTNIPHPMVVPDGPGWWLLTFDGTQYAEPVLGYGGHGDFIVMRG
ncbi:hypothetical protein [Actinophytocola sp.]|uniref:hypothetical protein n=1 Tax=Actinophytocola sp. TaxID=1872138 RepID=UPI003D6BCEAB